MGKIKKIIIDRFDGGMTEDRRSKSSNKFALTKHFDIFTYPHKLVPNPITYALNGENKTYDIVKFLYALSSGSTYYLYGLGKDASNDLAIYYTDISTQPTGDWTIMTNGDSGVSRNTITDEDVFFYYKNYIYFFLANDLSRVKSDDSEALSVDTGGMAWNASTVVQPVHHPADDIAYFFADNDVHKLNDTTWTQNALTFPTDTKIVAACPYGNYLAIATATKDTINPKSVVYLWDRDSTLATLSERIDFGTGTIIHMANLNNNLIAVQNTTADKTYGSSKARVHIKTASGNFGVTINSLVTDTTGSSNVFPKTNYVADNILYFPMSLKYKGDTRLGIWAVDSIGRTTLDLVFESATSYEGIYATGNTWYAAHSNDGSTDTTFGSSVAWSTTNPSIYESLIFNDDDSSTTKKLLGVSVTTEALPADGQIVLKYRKDEDVNSDSWTAIFTNTTDNSIKHDAINISGVTLPEFKEIQFRIESTGGAVVTSLKFKYEEIDKNIY